MIEAARYVVDASTAVKWHLEDEEYTHQALAILRDSQEGMISLIAPDNIRYEVPGAIRRAVVRGRLSIPDGRLAVANFLSLELHTIRSNSLTLLGYDYAFRFGCSLYDGLYLALADMARCPLILADRRLKNNLGNRFRFVLWIADYRI